MADFRLVDRGWSREIDKAVALTADNISVVCPFIKLRSIQRFFKRGQRNLRVVTRFDLNGFNQGLSDIEALREVIKMAGRVRGIKGLHSKLFVFGRHRAIAGSANLTEAAMWRNHEFGFVADDGTIVDQCQSYFDQLWKAGGADLCSADLAGWSTEIDAVRRVFTPTQPKLPDYGVAVPFGNESPFVDPEPEVPEDTQVFVKFFGSGHERADPFERVAFHVARGGCHWACTYGRRPRNVDDGATMYMARLTRRPNDIRIFGQAVGRRHRDGIDDASPAEIEARDWKIRWPYYVRVHSPVFVDGQLQDGVSLNELMEKFGHNSFRSTQRNAAKGHGNTNPRLSLSQQPQIELGAAAAVWLEQRLAEAYRSHGTIDLSRSEFDQPPSDQGGWEPRIVTESDQRDS